LRSRRLPAPPSFPTRRSSDLHESAARVLAARSGPPRGSEAGKHLVLRRRARSLCASAAASVARVADPAARSRLGDQLDRADGLWQTIARAPVPDRSEEHTSELQSRENLVCRLLLEKKKNK